MYEPAGRQTHPRTIASTHPLTAGGWAAYSCINPIYGRQQQSPRSLFATIALRLDMLSLYQVTMHNRTRLTVHICMHADGAGRVVEA